MSQKQSYVSGEGSIGRIVFRAYTSKSSVEQAAKWLKTKGAIPSKIISRRGVCPFLGIACWYYELGFRAHPLFIEQLKLARPMPVPKSCASHADIARDCVKIQDAIKPFYERGNRWIEIVLTQKNVEASELNSQLDKMQSAWEQFVGSLNFALGWSRSLEVTIGKGGLLHPHYHVLLEVEEAYFESGYLSPDDWCHLWQSAMQLDYKPVCHIQAVPKNDWVAFQFAVTEAHKGRSDVLPNGYELFKFGGSLQSIQLASIS